MTETEIQVWFDELTLLDGLFIRETTIGPAVTAFFHDGLYEYVAPVSR